MNIIPYLIRQMEVFTKFTTIVHGDTPVPCGLIEGLKTQSG